MRSYPIKLKPFLLATAFGAGLTALVGSAPALADGVVAASESSAATAASGVSAEIIVTARRRSENLQDVPLAISVVSGTQLEATGTSNVEQLTRLQPSLQFISSNPRNTATTVRGLGSGIGLTNDGLEQGVGIYVDEVYYARPGSAVVDLIDIDRVEVLRGPQGTLFGKNTTAGALNITTRAPSFTPEARYELSVGDYGYLQGKASLSGPLIDGKLAGRIAFGATRRDGLFKNVLTGALQNDINSQVLRAQLLYTPSDTLEVRLSYDYAFQNPEANTQTFVRYGASLRAANRQFPALAAALNYAPPSTNPYDRLVDINSPIEARQIINGLSSTVNWDLGNVTFTSISAFRNWDWTPQNDRDYTALSIRTKSNNYSEQKQFSQEFRLASNGDKKVNWVAGLYVYDQRVETNGVEQWGKDGAFWLIGTTVPANLIDGLTSNTHVVTKVRSYAAFGQLTWNVTDKFRITPGLRYTYEEKKGGFKQVVTGGLATTVASQITAKNNIAPSYGYSADYKDDSPSGQINFAYDLTPDVLTYVNLSKGYKSGGINAAGVPLNASFQPFTASIVVRPEEVDAIEAGLKTQFWNKRGTVNVAVYSTDVKDYQATVVDANLGAIRPYLANIEKVEVRGVEVDAKLRATDNFFVYGSVSYTDGRYASFKNGPAPLELQSSSSSVADLSGKELPGVSKWAGSLGGEYTHSLNLGQLTGEAYVNGDVSYRSDWNSDPSVSKYTVIDASTIANFRFGYRASGGTEVILWVKNAFDEEYLSFLSLQAGNSGAIYGQPGDPRTFGITVRRGF